MSQRMNRSALAVAVLACLMGGVSFGQSIPAESRQVGTDANNKSNPIVQPQDDAASGGGRDQTMQFGDLLIGTPGNDLLIGRLGLDTLIGGDGNDVMIGGTEHFNPLNRDRAIGGAGNDLFIWSPGDGSDLFDGGPGDFDTVVFGLIGEVVNGELTFGVSFDQQAGEVFIDPETGLPSLDVPASPGFCEVIDRSAGADVARELDELQLDHLVQFVLRNQANSFANGEQNEDNGLRVTLHLSDVEFLICTTREGGAFEVLDLTQSPPVIAPLPVLDAAVIDFLDNPDFP